MKKNSGFTLFELMIVISIIGILTAIAVPKLQEMQACSRGRSSNACQQFFKRAGIAPAPETIFVGGVEYRRVH